jgi:small-conductance mechanosensitive channel
MARRLTVLALLSLIGALLFATLVSQSLAQNAFNLARSIYITFLIINITSLIWLIGRIPALVRSNRGLRFILLLLLIIILAAELLGYRNLSYYLLVGLAGTVGIFVVFWVIGKLLSEFFSGLDEGRRSWQHTVRKRLGLQPHEPIPGLTALRFLTGLVLWATLGLFLLRVWGLSDAGLALILEYLVDGFQVGTIRVVPSKVLIGLLIFALLLTATRWFKGLLAKRWIRRTRLDAGAREAMVSITGYSGFIIAALVGLSMAGFNFQNIAIVAGALSVGIGFGLQNVVNNFVSGLIMLFERPVRTGDWVVVGATQGWVKRIRVRATEVQTFDRTDVIVPNSEFISNQVSNWTLRDRYGRIIIPVGVDYGSDIHLVKKLLLKVAHSHPQILIEGGVVHAPKVLFLAFGDSALLFEIRCFVKNIAEKWDIVSDINFEIARVFEEHNIQIPFPQRDLHVRDWPSATPLNKQTNGQGFLGSKDSSVKPSDPNPHDDSTSSA